MIGDTGAASLSESLKSNRSLTKLYLGSKDKNKGDTQKTTINNSLFSLSFASTGNEIEDRGATSLSDSLKSNTTLAEFYLWGEDTC